ncbi:hypothetical protein GWI33_003074 [Rhynchophorus ferrugineus]|uniref:Uncharacterized protein n=1 Tax=Rhynchophorus ferrugineus TaxID=354439 RepID=A0A834IND2_RHYFE|nr:hypothetical protein GWI33_003074 [Rhynchophorus ferrugineus]
MSRRNPSFQRRFSPAESNPYQITSLPLSHPPGNHPYQVKKPIKKGISPPSHQFVDAGFSDATTDSYYAYCDQTGLHHNRHKENGNTFSDDSGSTRLPYLEFDEESNRHSRFSDRSYDCISRHHHPYQHQPHPTDRRILNQENENWEDRVYQEIQTPEPVGKPNPSPRRVQTSRLSDGPQSSISSVHTSMVYGCGGKCQTFESICYFVLQLIFTISLLIGVSLCIAGVVLRKSAAKNLQVLVYIGILLAFVSGLLLTVQCRAKNTAKRRIRARQAAKRAPIPMQTLTITPNPIQHYQQNQNDNIRESQRLKPLPQVHSNTLHLTQKPPKLTHNDLLEEQPGIPWWRRKDWNASKTLLGNKLIAKV